MAEAKTAKKEKAAPAVAEEQTPHDQARKAKKKSRWTEDTCMRAAKRFTVRDEWAHGAPSSYKAAVAKGWDAKCCAHMTTKTSVAKVAKTVAKGKAVAKPKAPVKKSRTA